MHGAPSVQVPVGRSSFCARLLLALWGGGAAACLAWWLQAGPDPVRPALGTLAWLAAGAWAAHWWWRTPQSGLAWDGTAWFLADGAEARAGTVEVALDLQSALLLRWRGPDAQRWLWLDRHGLSARWADLRRAVYSRATPDAPPGPVPPPAHP